MTARLARITCRGFNPDTKQIFVLPTDSYSGKCMIFLNYHYELYKSTKVERRASGQSLNLFDVDLSSHKCATILHYTYGKGIKNSSILSPHNHVPCQ